MILAKVIGNVVATIKHPIYEGSKVMIVEPVDENYEVRGHSFLSCDFVQAGPGDIVLVAREGNASRQLFGDPKGPVHSVILGVVDHVDVS